VESAADERGFRADSGGFEARFPEESEDLETTAGTGSAGGGVAVGLELRHGLVAKFGHFATKMAIFLPGFVGVLPALGRFSVGKMHLSCFISII
jgi:hypothetical protein